MKLSAIFSYVHPLTLFVAIDFATRISSISLDQFRELEFHAQTWNLNSKNNSLQQSPNDKPCRPRNCLYDLWSQWSLCSDRCWGVKKRTRSELVKTDCGGAPCHGENEVVTKCNRLAHCQEGEPTCREFTPPAHGFATFQGLGNRVGDQANLGCETGYNLVGTQTRVCLPDKSWSGTILAQCVSSDVRSNGMASKHISLALVSLLAILAMCNVT